MSGTAGLLLQSQDADALSGDAGNLGTAELRHDLGSGWNGRWQAVAFVDTARVTVNKNVWVVGTNSATLSVAGVGLNWAGPNQWRANAYIATRLGSTPTLVASSASTRAWVEISKVF